MDPQLPLVRFGLANGTQPRLKPAAPNRAEPRRPGDGNDGLPGRLSEQPTLARDRWAEYLVALEKRLGRIEEALNCLLEQRTVKDWYTTAEAAQLLVRAEFTVREWCRLGRVQARKRACGRGRSQEWVIAHAELLRIQNEGLLPLPKH